MMTAIFGLLMGSWGAGQASQLAPDAGKATEGRNSIYKIIDRVPLIDSLSKAGSLQVIQGGSIEFDKVCRIDLAILLAFKK